MDPGAILTHLDIVLAVFALISALKSAYNGFIRSLVSNVQMIPEIRQSQQETHETQEKLVDAVVALSIAESEDGRTVDPKEVERNLRESGTVRDYLQRERDGTGPYTNIEGEEVEIPEEERRWRGSYDDD